MLFCDNGSEFTGQMWAYRNGVKIDFSRPGKPTDNAFCESFNGTFRAECLDTNWFQTLPEAKHIIEQWRREYIVSRPHRPWPIGRLQSSPVKSSLSAIWLKQKQVEN
jgi:putative transposase